MLHVLHWIDLMAPNIPTRHHSERTFQSREMGLTDQCCRVYLVHVVIRKSEFA
jgi:hypothetical protein